MRLPLFCCFLILNSIFMPQSSAAVLLLLSFTLGGNKKQRIAEKFVCFYMRGLSSFQNVIVRHNIASGSQFLTFSKRFMTVFLVLCSGSLPSDQWQACLCLWMAIYPLMFLFAEPKHACTLNQRRKCFSSRAHSPPLSLPL